MKSSTPEDVQDIAKGNSYGYGILMVSFDSRTINDTQVVHKYQELATFVNEFDEIKYTFQ